MSQEPLDAELAPVEAILRSLDPATSRLDFAQVMYLAGRASACKGPPARRRTRARWLWPCTTAASLLVAAMFAAGWKSSSSREAVERIIYVERNGGKPVAREPIDVGPAPEAPGNPWQEYARLCRVVLSEGLEGLPEPDLRPIADPGSSPWDALDGAALEARPEG